MDTMQLIWDSLKDSWITYIVAIVGVVVGFVARLAKFLDAVKKIGEHWNDFKAKCSGQKIPNQKLKEESKEIAQKIMELVKSRQAIESNVDFNDFQNTTNQMIRHSQETQNLYARDYASKVHALRDEFLSRKMKNEDLDRFYQHPTNYLGLKALAIGLATLSEQLDVT
jgi:glucuronate isomerase